MCWNPEVSLSTYLFAIFPLAILTFYYGKIPIYLFLALNSYISIQLIEFFLWTNLNDPAKNAFFSAIGLFAIILQPLFFILSIENGIPNSIIPLTVLICYVLSVMW